LREHFGAPKGVGVMVGLVEPDSPAAKAGIAVGDIIVAVAGTDVATPQAAARQVARKRGEQVEIKVIRDGKPMTLQATPAERVQRAVTRQRWAVADDPGKSPTGDEDGDEEVELAIEGGDVGELVDTLAAEIGAGPSSAIAAQRQAELDQRLKELDQKLKQLDAAIERLEKAKAAR
jgi:membrane-associated protease RseP (regulator of RpoE activity)